MMIDKNQLIHFYYIDNIIKRMTPEEKISQILSADQNQVHPDLAQIIRDFTKEVLKSNPEDVIRFALEYFEKKVEEKDKANMEAACAKK